MPSAKTQPFVGARPFSRKEKELFFGREREAHDLRSLIIAHPVVLLYASSGAGKTSLLNAAVIPLLEERGLEVLKPARVSGRLPHSIKREQVDNLYNFNILSNWADKTLEPEVLATQDLPGFLAARPHISDEVDEPQLRVVILDQFEELFTFAQERWRERQAVFEQLAAALEADPLLRVVLAMREDFIAQLDPYAPILPQGLHTRYHLDPLTPEAALEAVEGPLSNTEKSITPEASQALIEQLLTIRVKDAHGNVVETLGPYVEPVQLQVVCQSMWRGLPDEVNVIDAEQLQTFADVDEALRQFYVQTLTATSRHTQINEDALRQWFETFMITPAGTRGIAYRGETHTGRGEHGIPNNAVDELAAHHLVHAEVRAGDERWYELTHDRFIAPIQKSNKVWHDNITRRQRRRKRAYRALTSLVVVIVLAITFASWTIVRDREHQRVEGPVEELLALYEISPIEAQKKADSVLTNVAGYLWQRGSDDDLERLVNLLQQAKQVMPETSLAEQELSSVMPWADNAVEWPMTVHYHPDRALNSDILLYHWRLMSTWMVEEWGIPVPTELEFLKDKTLPVDRIRVTSPEAEKNINIPALPRFILVSQINMPGRLADWFNQHSAAWQEVETLEFGGPWWLVPLWTRPLFEAAGHPVYPRERAIATAVSNLMIDAPELVINRHNTSLLLERMVRMGNSVSVSEALHTRGGLTGLVDDLRNIVRQQYPITGLEYLLDALATYPVYRYSSDQAAEMAINDQFIATPGLLAAMSKPRTTDDSLDELAENTTLDKSLPYHDALTYLYDKPSIRIYVGEQLLPLIITPDHNLQQAIVESLIDLRGEVYKRFGYIGPSVIFDRDPWGMLAPNEFRIEILNQNHDDLAAEPIVIAPNQDGQDRILHELRKRYLEHRSWWLAPDYVNALLTRLPENTRDWLNQHYSITSIKILLRGVLIPGAEELQAYAANDIDAALNHASNEQSLRDLGWLLKSLVFWSQLRNPFDSDGLVNDLRQIQGSHMKPADIPSANKALGVQIHAGISALENDAPDIATLAFQQALASEPERAIEFFLAHYNSNRTNLAVRYDRYQSACQPLIPPGSLETSRTFKFKARDEYEARFGLEVRFEIEDLLERNNEQLNENQRLVLEYCLLEHYAGVKAERHLASSLEYFSDPSRIKSLSPEQIYTLGYWQLRQAGFTQLPPQQFEQTKRLLILAFHRWTEQHSAIAEAAFSELLNRYRWQLPPWYITLLEQVATAGPTNLYIMKAMGQVLAGGRNVSDIDRGIEWLGKAQKHLAITTMQDKTFEQVWLDYYVANAYYKRTFFSQAEQRTIDSNLARKRLEELIATLKKLGQLENPNWPAVFAYDNLIQVHLSNNAIEDASQVLKDAADLPELQENPLIQTDLFLLSLARGDNMSLQLAQRMYKASASEQLPEALFMLAIATLLNQTDDAEIYAREFFTTDHPFRDYIRLMLYWHLSKQGKPDQARAYLEERWQNIDASSWPARLQQGDAAAWREQLIAYFLGELPQEKLFAPLLSRQSFDKSALRHLGVYGLNYQGLSSEAYFYDALLQQVSGDPSTQQSRYEAGLQKTLKLSNAVLYEYLMASYLLKTQNVLK